MDNDSVLPYLSTVIKSFNSMYLEFNSNYYLEHPNQLNLKKTYVSYCELDSNFNSTIITYLNCVPDFLFENNNYFALQTTKYGTFRARTKSLESLYVKIHHYSQKELTEGGAPVNKCLNDLFGSRIILPHIRTKLGLITQMLTDLKNSGIIWRYYIRDKNDNYFAIHCYFKQDNFTFPWELQIWDYNDEANNIKAHEAHEEQKRVTI